MNTKKNFNNVALQIGTESPVSHHLHKYLLYLYFHLILQMVRDSPTNSLLILYISTWRQKEGDDAYGGAETEKGVPPWLLGLGIPGNTPSVSDAPGNYGGGGTGGVGGGQATARIPGMFFYHPDHLGSITMITDGHGQVLAGGERGGKSHIAYRPYGEIHRTDSFGPDISKYKYTGQEEDKESGLYYYKARYYDPVIGRFAQADSMAFPDRIQGMNRMMYVEGNPMSFTDGSGHMLSNSWAAAIVAYHFVKDGDGSDMDKFIAVASAYAKGRAKDRRRSNNFLDRSLNTGNFFQGIERNSALGRGATHIWNEYKKTDSWKVYERIGENWKRALKNPRGFIEQSDLSRSYLGRSITFNWNLYKKSDIGRAYTKLGQNMIRSAKDPRGHIEQSDVSRSDLGRLVTRNRQALITMYDASGITNISTGGIIWKNIFDFPLIGKVLGVVGVVTAYYEICFNQQACIMGQN